MTQQRSSLKGNMLKKMGRAGLIIVAILLSLGGALILPFDDSSLNTSHPNPVIDYAQAMQRVESLRAGEVGFNPECHTILLTHGARTAKAIVFVPGYGSCPAAFKELGAIFYER